MFTKICLFCLPYRLSAIFPQTIFHMKCFSFKYPLLTAFILIFSCSPDTMLQNGGSLQVAGLKAEVEILRDRWGVNHIYAQNEHDLFFAQGYAAAKDRLFQFEMWRRRATGSMS